MCSIKPTPSADAYTDWGYPTQERESDLTVDDYRPKIQRRWISKRKLSESQQRRNHRIAKARPRVEHLFATVAQMHVVLISTIG